MPGATEVCVYEHFDAQSRSSYLPPLEKLHPKGGSHSRTRLELRSSCRAIRIDKKDERSGAHHLSLFNLLFFEHTSDDFNGALQLNNSLFNVLFLLLKQLDLLHEP